MRQFIYDALNETRREIRLVRLIALSMEECQSPNVSHTSDKLKLQMKSQSLDGAPDDRRTSFSALSYCWNPLQGAEPSTFEIMVNGNGFKVTSNLYDALRRFRKKSLTEWLWIDAICINQADEMEKSWQVRQMRDVYKNSETVYMWLGNSNEGAEAMDFISQVGKEAVDCDAADMANPHLSAFNTNAYSLSVILGRDTGDSQNEARTRFNKRILQAWDLWQESPTSNGLRLILTNPYWTRVWVIQEVFLAKNGIVMKGEKEVPLNYFEETLGGIKFNKTLGQNLTKVALDTLSDSLLSIRSLDLRRNHHGEHVSLKDILWQDEIAVERPHYAATNSRDVVMGLLGVLSPEEVDALSVDYSATIKSVFTKVTRLFLRHETDDFGYWRRMAPIMMEETWRWFSLASCIPRDPPGDSASTEQSLPTWVPDWAAIGLHGPQVPDIPHRRCCSDWPDGAARDREQPTLNMDSKITDDPVLKFRGFQVDTIVEVMVANLGSEPIDPSKDTTSADAWLQSVCDFTHLDQVIEEGEEDQESGTEEVDDNDEQQRKIPGQIAYQVWQALKCFMEYSPYRYRSPKRIHSLCLKILRREAIDAKDLTATDSLFLRRAIWKRPQSVFYEDQEEGQIPSAERTEEMVRERRNLLAHQNKGRTLFKTASGRIGLGRLLIKPGDKVTILWETKAPIVLRKRESGGWTFSGDCYIAGIMRGELMTGGISEETFDIY